MHVASIELDRHDRARGEIFILPVEGEDGPAVEVFVETLDGFESPGLPTFPHDVAAREAIEATWGCGPWDLQWI